jgi:hypothetical protein
LLWASGITRDCLISASLYTSFYAYYQLLHKQIRLRYVLFLAVGLLSLLIFRNYMLVLVLAAFLPWWFATRTRTSPLLIFGGFFLLYVMLFFGIRYLIPSINPPLILVEKQEDFFTLVGQSRIETPKLEPVFSSFLTHSSHALGLSLFRPHFGEARSLLQIFACLEIVACWSLLIWWFFRYKGPWRPDAAIACCIMFCLAELLVMGFIVNFLGAIARYRSILLPLLLTPLLATIQNSRGKHIY